MLLYNTTEYNYHFTVNPGNAKNVGQPTLGEKSEDVEDMKFEEKSEDI